MPGWGLGVGCAHLLVGSGVLGSLPFLLRTSGSEADSKLAEASVTCGAVYLRRSIDSPSYDEIRKPKKALVLSLLSAPGIQIFSGRTTNGCMPTLGSPSA
eukprot:2559457-Pleurochrysis_carterae.AAC.3